MDKRVRIVNEGADVAIGDTEILLESLQTWKGWDKVIAIGKKIEPPLTHEELERLGEMCKTTAGQNGYRETLAALRGMGRLPAM